MLPNIDIDVATLRVDRIVFASAVAGERQEARLSGKIAIADRRAQVRLDAATIGADAKGDTLKLLLDAVPERNRLAMTLDLDAPQRSEENTPELQSLMRSPYAVFCLNK